MIISEDKVSTWRDFCEWKREVDKMFDLELLRFSKILLLTTNKMKICKPQKIKKNINAYNSIL